MASDPSPENPSPADAERLILQLRRSREELDHFVRALSHDMTANFMVLDRSFQHLKDSLVTGDRDEQEAMVAHVEACLSEWRRFLDDMVLLSRTGSVQMQPRPVEVDEIVDEVLFEQREILGERGVEVDVRRPLLPVWCNRQRLKQVLTNLVRNAVKHGCDPSHPRIVISTDREPQPVADSGPRLVALRVQDNGPGIDSRYHEEIFLPGRRFSDRSEEGSGMGLAIVRKIAEYYGGSATIDPAWPEGAMFVVTLADPPEISRRQEAGRFPFESRDLRRIEHDTPHEEPLAHRHKAGKAKQRALRPQ